MVGRLVQDGLIVTEIEKGDGCPATVIKLNPDYTEPTNRMQIVWADSLAVDGDLLCMV